VVLLVKEKAVMVDKINVSEKPTFTFSDYADLPEGAPYQLIKGNLIMTPAPTPYHQKVSWRLMKVIDDFLESQSEHIGQAFAAPLDVYFEETEVFQPDLIFIRQEREHIIGEQKIEGAPDLVVEILSEATAYYDLRHKKAIYAKHGVPEYWIIDPMAKSFEVYELRDEGYQLISEAKAAGTVHSKVLAGLSSDVTPIF
jgi:Uma2 family endonuclease